MAECVKSYIKKTTMQGLLKVSQGRPFRHLLPSEKHLPRIEEKEPENRGMNSETTMVWPKD